MKRILTILGLVCAVTFTSCRRDELYYGLDNRAVVRIEANWEAAHLKPNGISAFVFDNNGRTFGPVIQSNNPGSVDILLPEGQYQVLLLNNSPNEYKNAEIVGTDRLSRFAIVAKRKLPRYTVKNYISPEIFVEEPDTIAGSIVRNIEIDRQMIEYFRRKPVGQERTPTLVLRTTPTRVISVVDIKVHIKGLKNAAGAPRTHLINMSGGFYPDVWRPHSARVGYEFILNNRQFDEGSTQDGTITKRLTTFGLHETNDVKYLLNMEFVLIDGNTHSISLDVTDKITTTEGVHQTIYIRAEIELPEAIGNGNGAFDSEIEEWDNINVDIPM